VAGSQTSRDSELVRSIERELIDLGLDRVEVLNEACERWVDDDLPEEVYREALEVFELAAKAGILLSQARYGLEALRVKQERQREMQEAV
jgi:hypothetical protein